jgi:hypothetical protein
VQFEDFSFGSIRIDGVTYDYAHYSRNLMLDCFHHIVSLAMDRLSLSQPETGYSRRVLNDGRMLIQSTCDYCGLKIVGSILETLLEDEREHRAKCSKPQAVSGSS